MRIALNLSSLAPRTGSGLDTYVRGLLQGLEAMGGGHEFRVVVPPHAAASNIWKISRANWQYLVVTDPAAGSFDLTQHADPCAREVAERVRREGLDVWFTPNMKPTPPELPCATVGMLLDVQQESWPQFYDAHELARRAVVYETVLRCSTLTLTISEFCKQQLVELFAVVPGQLAVTPLGLTREFLAHLAAEARPDFPLPARYLYYPAATWGHKNHAVLLRAFASVTRKFPDLHLVLTGQREGAHEHVLQLASELGLRERVQWRGHVRAEYLPWLYRQAAAMVYPSLFEGFGLPPLEAMACGCPVIASRAASIPEVVGEAALQVDAQSLDALAIAMIQVLENPAVAMDLRKRGFERAGAFTFEMTAQRTLAALQAAAQIGPKHAAPPCHVNPDHSFLGTCRYYFHAPHLQTLKVAGTGPAGAQIEFRLNQQPPARFHCSAAQRFKGVIACSGASPAHELVFTLQQNHAAAQGVLEELTLVSANGQPLELLPAALAGGGHRAEMLLTALLQACLPLAAAGVRKVALYGAGSHTAWLLNQIRLAPLEIICIVDDYATIEQINGIPVCKPERWPEFNADALIVSSDQIEDKLVRRAMEWLPAGIPIARLYQAPTIVPRA